MFSTNHHKIAKQMMQRNARPLTRVEKIDLNNYIFKRNFILGFTIVIISSLLFAIGFFILLVGIIETI